MAGVVESLRASRGVLEQAASQRLKRTHESLEEVSSATETAATQILDGLDRALELVDHLDPGTTGEAAESADASDVASRLRDELHSMMGHVQFQDITAQQLGHASGVIKDIEARLIIISDFFDISGLGLEELAAVGMSIPIEEPAVFEAFGESCDPDASTLNAESRQTVADDVFTSS